MNHPYDDEQWAALLDADPALWKAWNAYRIRWNARLDAMAAGEDTEGDGLGEACDAVYAQVGEGQTKH